MPSHFSESGCVSGNEPIPIRVVATGIRYESANRNNSSDAPAAMTPPPATMQGRSERRIASRISAIRSAATGGGSFSRRGSG